MADDVIKNARGELKRAAARVAARREETMQKLTGLNARKDTLSRDRELAVTAGETNLVADIDRALGDLTEQIDHLEALLAQDTSTFSEIQDDFKRLENVAAEHQVSTVRRTAAEIEQGGDPFAPSAEDIALENARNAVAELEARLEVERELNSEGQLDRDSERRLRELDAIERDNQARETLKALKEERKNKGNEKKKRTL